MSRSRSGVLLSFAAFLAVGCGGVATDSQDLGYRPNQADMAQSTSSSSDSNNPNSNGNSPDLAMSLAGGCMDLDAYCSVPGNFCVRTWGAAQGAASWCSPGKDVDVFLPATDCPGVRMVQLGGGNFYDNKQYYYSMDGDGVLLAVVSIGEGGYACDAGDPSFSQNPPAGCTLADRKICENGQITN